MADDSELDYLRTFLIAAITVGTATTVKHADEVGNKANIAGGVKIYIAHGEPIGFNMGLYQKVNTITLQQTTEALLGTMFNQLIIGINKLNFRETIAAYTRPAVLIGLKLRLGSKTKRIKNKYHKMELQLVSLWSCA